MPCSLQLKAVLEAHGGCNAISLGCAGARVGVRPGPARPLSSPCQGGRFSALWSKEYRMASESRKWLTTRYQRQSVTNTTVAVPGLA